MLRNHPLSNPFSNFYNMKKILFYSLLLLSILTSCKTSNLFVEENTRNTVQDLDSVFLSNNKYEYQIRIDDKITISVWGQDEFSVGSTYGIYNSNEVYGKWLMVDAKGNIEIPKIGNFHVEKMTIVQLKESLKKIYGEWIKTPIVDIKILNQEITVLGEVRDPQVIPVDKSHNSLLGMIARCKGFDFYANTAYIKVFRQVGKNVHVANINLTKGAPVSARNINLYPGDVVVVPSKKYKEFDKRVSTIIPFTTALTSAAIFLGAF